MQPSQRLMIRNEALAFLSATLLWPLGLRRRPRPTARQKQQRTTVFVHGFLANQSSFIPLRTYLRFRGVTQVLAFNYAPGESIYAAAIRFKRFLAVNVRGGRIDLVCHSLGGLVARVYLQDLGGARRVDRCITLGTPHQGTYNAYWALGHVGRDLRPGSALLARLAFTQPQAASVRFTSVVAGGDNIVLPRLFASASADLVQFPLLGHLGLLYAPSVFRLVAARLLLPA